MKARLFLLVFVLIAFTAYSTVVVAQQGYFGFLELALSDAWGGQVFLDLVIALTLFFSWMLGDARAHDISPWPYAVLIFTLGSIGALGYMIHRTTRQLRASSPAHATA